MSPNEVTDRSWVNVDSERVHVDTWPDLLELDRKAVQATTAALTAAIPGDLHRRTPCAGWTLADLLAHMTVQQDGFAEASTGAVTELERWTPVRLGDAAVPAYTAACERVLAAFHRPGVADRAFPLPEIRSGGAFPARQAVGFHLVDNAVHAWDVAVTLGGSPALDADVVDAALVIVEAIPDGPERLRPGAAFAPALEVSAEAPALDRMLLLLGRSPEWSAVTGR